MKQAYKIDVDGFLKFGEVIEVDGKEEVPTGYTDIPLPKDEKGNQLPFYRPRFVEGVWIEDMAQEEIDELNNQLQKPNLEERLQALEMMELERILGGM